MKFERYAIAFILSFVMHLAVFAASPGDPFHRWEGSMQRQSMRLRVVNRPKVVRVDMDRDSFDEDGKVRGREKSQRGKNHSPSLSRRETKAVVEPETRIGDPMGLPDKAFPALAKEEAHGSNLGKGEGRFAAEGAVTAENRTAGVPPSEEGEALLSREPELHVVAPVPRFSREVGEGEEDGHGIFTPPAIDSVPEPEYPEYSRKHGEEGVVTLLVDIDETGRGSKVAVLRSSGYRRLDRSAVFALEQARFIPANQGGQPVPSRKKIAVRFSLRDGD